MLSSSYYHPTCRPPLTFPQAISLYLKLVAAAISAFFHLFKFKLVVSAYQAANLKHPF
jgi:hypothetical protein